jgi:aspartate carbamoyltransferase regulatory subunit
MLNISGIEDGYVIDHIGAGKSMDIYKYLRLDKLDCQVAIIKNAASSKMGKKDIIKVQGDMDLNLDLLGFIDDRITVNIIRGGKIIDKMKPQLPEVINNVIRCKNPRCISSVEQELPQVFKLTDVQSRTYRCIYCEEKFDNK